MNGFNRYVLKQLAVGMLLVTASLVAIIWLTQSLRFVEMIVNRGLSAGTFLHLTGLLLPNFVAVILPIAVVTIVIFTYNRLMTDRELLVMGAIGQSQTALSAPALQLSSIVMLISFGLNLYLVPESYKAFRELQWAIRNNFSQVLLREGAFSALSGNTTVYVRERGADGQLLGVLVHDNSVKETPVTIMAERGSLINAESGPKVIMFDGNRQSLDRATNKLSILYFDRSVYELNTGGGATNRHREARERHLFELLDAANRDDVTSREVGKFVVEAHRRLSNPILCVTLVLIALACLLTGDYSRRGLNRRILVATSLVIGLQGLVLGAENLVSQNLALVPVLYAIIALPILPALYVLKRPPVRIPAHQAAPA